MDKIVKIMETAISDLNNIREELRNSSTNSMGINIIIDNENPQSPVFVEIETDQGESIRIGEELTNENGYRKLRISVEDIIQHEKI